MGRLAALGCAALLAACSNDRPAPPPPPRPALEFPDAAVAPPAPAPVPVYDPATGLRIDDDWAARRFDRPRQRRTLEITLRSTPNGALAAVDGTVVGRTPTLWEGEFTGQAREFTFVLPGYTVARYRFAPITSGVVHGRLDKAGDGDAGVPEIPLPEPGPPEPAPRREPPVHATPAAPDAGAGDGGEPPDAAPLDVLEPALPPTPAIEPAPATTPAP